MQAAPLPYLFVSHGPPTLALETQATRHRRPWKSSCGGDRVCTYAAKPSPTETAITTKAWSNARTLKAATLPAAAFPYHVFVTPCKPENPANSRGTTTSHRKPDCSGLKQAAAR